MVKKSLSLFPIIGYQGFVPTVLRWRTSNSLRENLREIVQLPMCDTISCATPYGFGRSGRQKKDQTEQQRRGNAELVSGLKTKLSALEQELAGLEARRRDIPSNIRNAPKLK